MATGGSFSEDVTKRGSMKEAALSGLPQFDREFVIVEAARMGIVEVNDPGWMLIATLVRSQLAASSVAEALGEFRADAEKIPDAVYQAAMEAAQGVAKQEFPLFRADIVSRVDKDVSKLVAEITAELTAARSDVMQSIGKLNPKKLSEEIDRLVQSRGENAANQWVEAASRSVATRMKTETRASMLGAWIVLLIAMSAGGVIGLGFAWVAGYISPQQIDYCPQPKAGYRAFCVLNSRSISIPRP